MLRLDTQFTIRNLDRHRIFKVISVQEMIEKGVKACAGDADLGDLLLWLDSAHSSDLHSLMAIPVGGFLLADDSFDDNHPSATLLSRPRDLEVVKPGDVVSVGPESNRVRVLYRRGSNSNLLFMTDRCNSLCLMCSQPPKDIDDRWHIDENLKLIELMDPGVEQLGISGGEPTLYRDGLLAIIAHAKAVLPEKSLHLLSNGRLLCDSSWIEDLKHVGHTQLTWGVPLYADNAADHDHVVQAPGAFSETIAGLYNLHRAGQRIEIRVVLSKLTATRLPELAHFIFRNLPFASHVALMGIENTGLAKKNYEMLWIDPADYQEQLKRAAWFLDIRGLAVSIYNLPLCVLDPVLRNFYRQSISDWKNLFIDACQSCAATESCAGFFKSHSERWQSRNIRALSREELITTQGAIYETA
ncbi:His-Xaa-Ser system radical SAM maturase HxsC [Pseudomonas asplenii]|uniref:His-Xaa-Ser system radical SAM maturase HxsC n=1 Tax=Pseudomonas asplenii TaxID=53407 RepID=A0A1H1ZDI5_9PSED|nr:His-Xaa-Ser system radical SAM maturase HxsC [Pseudomonas asplenii]SDT31841.1 His-Xaa-Ser system radical SAM maturase HxsC [Pseudomonas asplenii]